MYNYIDVSIINTYGTVSIAVPFKLITYNFRSFENNKNIDLNFSNQIGHNINASNKYFSQSPPFGSYEIVNSTLIDKNDKKMYSDIGIINQSMIELYLYNIKTQSTKNILIHQYNTLKNGTKSFVGSYVVSKITVQNIIEYIYDAPPVISYLDYDYSNKYLNYKFIPAFQDTNNSATDYSLWRINNPTATENTFQLFKKENDNYYVCYSPYSINSERYSFNIARSGPKQIGGNFKINNIRILVNAAFENVIYLHSFGINSQKNSVGDANEAPSQDFSHTHTKYFLNKDNKGTYYVKDLESGNLFIDSDNSDSVLFSFWMNVNPPHNENDNFLFRQLKLSHSIENITLFNVQIEGEYLNPHLSIFNKNILSATNFPSSTTYGIAIYEYKKTINIFELDDGNTALNKISPNQIGELKIKKMALAKMIIIKYENTK